VSRLVEIDWRPERTTLRRFGWIALGGFAGLALGAGLGFGPFALLPNAFRPWLAGALAALAVLCALFSWLAPAANRPIFVGLSLLAFPIGWVLSQLMLGLLFFGLITPVGLALRLLGRDPLQRRQRPELPSYWQDARPEVSKERYFRQF